MSKDVLVRYSKEYLLERKQTCVRVSNSPKKLAIGGKIKPLGPQRVGHENRVIILLEMSDKCEQSMPNTPRMWGVTIQTIKRKLKLFEKT